MKKILLLFICCGCITVYNIDNHPKPDPRPFDYDPFWPKWDTEPIEVPPMYENPWLLYLGDSVHFDPIYDWKIDTANLLDITHPIYSPPEH